MLNQSIKVLSIGATLVLGASGAWAQTGSTVDAPETNIGVTPQDARESMQKAVPGADTGTLVRTEPSASDRASEVAEDAKDAATPDTRSSTSNNGRANDTGNNSGNSLRASADNNEVTTIRNRPARADRN